MIKYQHSLFLSMRFLITQKKREGRSPPCRDRLASLSNRFRPAAAVLPAVGEQSLLVDRSQIGQTQRINLDYDRN